MKLLILLCALVCCAIAAHVEKTCHEKADPGMCLAYIPQFYFDAETGTCKRFVYGGCQGNGNRYDSEEECLNNCKRQQQADVDDACSLDAETGPCRAFFPRYFFNKKTGKCEEFVYGGCQGNANNFPSQEACESECPAEKARRAEDVCTLNYETGPCRARMPRYYFDSKTGKCELFIYGGCKGNGNNFKTVEECRSTCAAQAITQNAMICKLESDSGPCKAFVTRYFYDYRTGQCKEFIYGGCKGNENNFLTLADCQKACRTDTQRPSNLVCSLDFDVGPCKAFVTRYYYDQRTRKCKTFTYGGCQGNENNFLSESDCLSACSGDTKRPQSLVCNLEKDPGPCDAYVPRYYYDHLLRQCKQFVYGGCKGNENNFKTEAECRNTCESNGTLDPSLGTCNQSPDAGNCRGSFPRYYYNPRTRTCETFIYGGCGGNSNNFQTYQECVNACANRV